MKRVMVTLFMIIFMVSTAFSAGPFQPILTDVANIPELEDLNLIKRDELLTFGNSLTKLYFWDLNSRDSINKNFPIELNGKLLTQPITQRIFNDGLNYLTYCVEGIEGNIYFHCIDFKGSEYPGFPLLLQDKPVTTPVFLLIETNVYIMYSTESGQVIYFDLTHSLIPEEHHSIQTSGTDTEIYLKDISGDTQKELICKTYITENYYVIEYYEYLNEVWELSSNSLDFTGEIGSNLLFLDVTGDNIEEVIFGDSTGQLFIYSIFPNFTLIPNYPKVISNGSIEIINYIHGNTVAVTDSRKNTYEISLDSFSKEKILDRKYANQYSNYSLSTYLDIPGFTGIVNYFTRFGSDVTIIKDTGELEKWGYFNHSI
ncbi:hypothetical protein KAU33_14465, partial [Candidatus Dependentiae bacterium]|nr:hypothetical protein [Candidatus Dependentiae bacterium]